MSLDLSLAQEFPVWIVVVGFIIAFFLAFGVGANDVANSFGTSVGSKVLTLRQACILATICEVSGAVLLGYKVSETIRKDIYEESIYADEPKLLMIGNLAVLLGSAIWNIVATLFRLPVSGTHSIVGAVVGFSLVAMGTEGMQWGTLGKIVASWFVSPVLSGLVSAGIFLGVRHFILKKDEPLEPGLQSLPFFYGSTILINLFSIIHDGPKKWHLDKLSWWIALLVALGAGTLVSLVVWFVVVPRMRRRIKDRILNGQESKALSGSYTEDMANGKTETEAAVILEVSQFDHQQNGHAIPIDKNAPITSVSFIKIEADPVVNGDVESTKSPSLFDAAHSEHDGFNLNSKLFNGNGKKEGEIVKTASMAESQIKPEEAESDKPEAAQLFSSLQILTAICGSFAHGANDVSNAIGPLITLWLVYLEGTAIPQGDTPIYILLYGGIGISAGLWIWGRKVIKTLGEDLTKITPSSGFTIEIGAATTVLVASKIGLPISTTHCKVGSVVFVGWLRSRQGVDWSLFRNIVMAWVLTVPVSGLLTAAIMAVLQVAVM